MFSRFSIICFAVVVAIIFPMNASAKSSDEDLPEDSLLASSFFREDAFFDFDLIFVGSIQFSSQVAFNGCDGCELMPSTEISVVNVEEVLMDRLGWLNEPLFVSAECDLNGFCQGESGGMRVPVGRVLIVAREWCTPAVGKAFLVQAAYPMEGEMLSLPDGTKFHWPAVSDSMTDAILRTSGARIACPDSFSKNLGFD